MFERGRKEGGESAQNPGDNRSTGAPAARPAHAGGSGEMAVIGRSIRIDGDLQGEEDLRIEGRVTGTVKLVNNSLTIGKEGEIHADVYAKTITVDGVMEGDLFGAEQVAIRRNARVKGNITAPRVSLEDGAHFKGSIEMDAEAVEAALGKQGGARKPAAVAPAAAAGKKQESVA
ncbi:MAG: polymer-forming cytoskeletal protein [Gammaproteobacteria bacterium]|jgi:cytoskeletal protein CcmA (bactofilin family)|nr:polymer-forming cytoskeletal protein [Gammaproteobacteria bacterium]